MKNPKYVVILSFDTNKPLISIIACNSFSVEVSAQRRLCLLLKDKSIAEKFIRTKFCGYYMWLNIKPHLLVFNKSKNNAK